MDQKNLILAIVLSAIIMIGWQFYAIDQMPPPSQDSADATVAGQPGTTPTTPDAPGIQDGKGAGQAVPVPGAAAPVPAVAEAAQRKAAMEKSPRIKIQSSRLSGSVSLTGARFDDLTLTDYRETIEEDSDKISLLLPFGAPKPYYADFGWVSADTKVPDANTAWQADKNTLTPETPVNLTWINGDGVKFTQTLELDANYMFSITQRVENQGDKPATVYPFGRISRTGTPEITDFYILHEGLLGVFDGVLKEVDYDEIQESKVIQSKSTGGWIGITDKYWMTALIPDQKSAADTRFSDQVQNKLNTYQVDYRGGAMVIPAGGFSETKNKFFAGAKEAPLILDYRDNLNISRFDLAIDWGWFEFLTKPIFFALIYFTDHLGNMGLSILLLTVLIKLAFFPLANKSYRAMSKMKLLQPEMVKIRERFKEDRTRMNQEVMALYKREKANPASGCLPILPQIPVLQSGVRHHRDAPRAFLRLDQGFVRGRPLDPGKSVRRHSLDTAGNSGNRRLADHHGRHHVYAAKTEPATPRSHAGENFHVPADHVHVYAGPFSGGIGDLLGLE